MRTVWRLITHHEKADTVLAWAVRNRRLAIGWGMIGNLNDSAFNSAEKIARFLAQDGESTPSAILGGQCLYDFRFRMKPGDLVILSTGKGGARRLVMEVLGEYEWRETPARPLSGDYQHQRKARIVDMDPDELWETAGGKQLSGLNIHSALVQCSNHVDEATLAAVGVHQGLRVAL